MKTSKIVLYTVVLWTLVECRHAGRLGRSLDAERKGSNLTQTQQQEVIHADVIQHFTTTTPTPVVETTHDSTSPYIKEVPLIPEDINVQNLKNDDLHVLYDRRISIDREHIQEESSVKKNETVKSNTNDVISYKYNQTGVSSSTRSEVLLTHSSYEHSSTSVVYDEEDNDENEETHTHYPVVSSTESLKTEHERKSFENKKKEKNKKEIPDTVTVPTDINGVGRIEKPYKDNIISVKLKEKNKDSNSEALDERRSTIRISDSSSISLSEHDNNSPLSSLDILKTGSSSTNNDDSVNQSVNSVISGNGVNNDSVKKPRVKYSIKKAQDVANDTDTEADNSSSNGNLLSEDAAKHIVPILSLEPKTTPPVQTEMISDKKLTNSKQYPSIQQQRPTESTPTKIDILGKIPTSSTTTVIKPSIAFKQQLANKLKGLETTPTASLNSTDDIMDENQEKFNSKLTIKSNLRKKPKPEHYASSSEVNIPSTATAWTLVSMKSAADGPRNLRKPATLLDTSPLTLADSSTTSTPKQTTITPASRVKSFVPWSTRLQKNTSFRPPSTTSLDLSSTENMAARSDSDMSPSSSNEQIQKTLEHLKLPQKFPPPSTTEQQSVLRTTEELERNITETSINLVQPSLNDVMVQDQSSTASQESSKAVGGITTEVLMTSKSTLLRKQVSENSSKSDIENKAAENENIIETKHTFEENDAVNKSHERTPEKVEEKTTPSSINNTVNEVLSTDISENMNQIKNIDLNQTFNFVPLTTSPSPVEMIDNGKQKNSSDVVEIDSGPSDILVDGPGDEGGKSVEESDEDFKPKQTTTLLPNFEPFETTVMPDLDEDVEGESDREEEDLAILIDKLANNQTTSTIHAVQTNTTEIEIKPTAPSLPENVDLNSNSTYVTSFDIISRENTTQVVTNTPLEGDINWYSIDTKPVNTSVDEATQKKIPVDMTTTEIIRTTNEPEMTTDMSNLETTIPQETTEIMSPTTPIPTTPTLTSTPTIPTVESTVPQEDISGFDCMDDPTSSVRIVVHVSPLKLCHEQQQLRESIASQLMSDSVSWEQVLIKGRNLQNCRIKELVQNTTEQDLDLDVCFIDKNQDLSPTIRDEFLRLYTKRANDPRFPIVEVQLIVQPTTMTNGFDNVLAAIVLSIIAAVCLVLLGILLVIIRKRQSRFNYGQRCTPVSLDDYSLDNISVYNSVRRKGALRASKRSYGNPGFDDPSGPTHAINFAGLANFSSDREALDEEFNQIPMITVKPDELSPGAESKNRYANVIPLPETRVLLQTKNSSDPLAEYINANYVKGTKGHEKLYIACQAPMQSTVEDFWRMVWQQQTKVILMLTALNENGVEKCADYLPQLEITDCHRLFGDFQVTLKKHEVREKYIISNLQLKNLETNLWREVTHLWYSSWPSQGVPEDGSAMIAFLIEARSYMRGAQGPTVVHCSPGTGRTGTVIAIDMCIRDFETLRSVDIPKTVYALRRNRAGAVQTKDQYAFIYQVLNLYATKLTGGALDSI